MGGQIIGTPGAHVDGTTLRVYVSGTDGTPYQYDLVQGRIPMGEQTADRKNRVTHWIGDEPAPEACGHGR